MYQFLVSTYKWYCMPFVDIWLIHFTTKNCAQTIVINQDCPGHIGSGVTLWPITWKKEETCSGTLSGQDWTPDHWFPAQCSFYPVKILLIICKWKYFVTNIHKNFEELEKLLVKLSGFVSTSTLIVTREKLDTFN